MTQTHKCGLVAIVAYSDLPVKLQFTFPQLGDK